MSKTCVKSLSLSSANLSSGGSSAEGEKDSEGSADELEGVNGAAPYVVSPKGFWVCGASGLRPMTTVLSSVRSRFEHLSQHNLRNLIRMYRPAPHFIPTFCHEDLDFLILPSQSPSQKSRRNTLETL